MSFKRYPRHRKSRLGDAWRRPRGWQNKLRLEKKGHGKRVKVGYRTAAEQRGQRKGLELVTVYNVNDVKALDAKTQGAVIGNIGTRKEIDVLNAIMDGGVTLLTGDPAKRLTDIEEAFKSRKKTHEQREKEREERQKQLEQKAAEKEAEEAAETSDSEDSDLEKAAAAEDEKKAKKEEQDKVLTKAR